jgi:murein L,D-transpeptidase YafK
VGRIHVIKKVRKLTLIDDNGERLFEFRVALGANPKGHKHKLGDERTPEGLYEVSAKRDFGETRFYRGFLISYPNEADRARAHINGDDPGGNVLIHGLPDRFRWSGKLHWLMNWTDGCIAVTNRQMDKLWPHVEVGTTIEIE